MDNEIKVSMDEGAKELVLLTGNAKRIFNYNGTDYKALNTQSFIRLCEERHTENTVVGCNPSGAVAILDDSIVDSPRDRVTMDYERSIQLKEWQSKFDDRLEQKDIVKFLKTREEGEIKDSAMLMAAIKYFKFVSNISADYSMDDGDNYTFAFKVKDTDGTVTIPKEITVNMELINGSGNIQPIEVDVEVIRPKNETEKPTFVLTCPKLEKYIEKATKVEEEKIIKRLDGMEGIVVVNAVL
jgi:hypothetical protein